MDDESRQLGPPSSPPGYHASGVLLHVASLPSPYGIGDVGPVALAWRARREMTGSDRSEMTGSAGGRSLVLAILIHAVDNTCWKLFPNDGSHYNPTAMAAVMVIVTMPIIMSSRRDARW